MRILVVNLLNIGDVLFMTPALEALRALHPDAEIDVLVKHFVSDVISHNPDITRTIPIDIKGYHRSLPHLLELTRALRANDYDLLFDLHGSSRTWLISALCGARLRCGLAPRVLPFAFHRTTMRRTDIHRIESCLQIMNDLGFPADNPGKMMKMTLDQQSSENARRKWSESGIDADDTVIGLNPGARTLNKVWPPERWAVLADELNNGGFKTAIFGGPEDLDQVGKLVSTMKTESPVFTGQLSLLELAAMLSWCRILVSGDTGPLHIAASQGTPIVGLYGASNPVEFGPYGVPYVVCSGEVEASDGEPVNDMERIKIDQVTTAIKQLLELPVQ